jgi:uncharacterized protein (TIGR02996 family)
MPFHPDADAFLRAILDNLDDATPRLVFADWLEETDEPANVAWARYIRVQAELAAQPPIGGRWGELEDEAADEALRFEATLKVPAKLLVEQTRALLRLLPIERVTVDIAGYVPPRAVVELIPESVAARIFSFLSNSRVEEFSSQTQGRSPVISSTNSSSF